MYTDEIVKMTNCRVVNIWNIDSGSTVRNGLPSVVLHVLYTCKYLVLLLYLDLTSLLLLKTKI